MTMILPLGSYSVILDDDDWDRVTRHTWSVFVDGLGTPRCVTRVNPYAFLLNRFVMQVVADRSVHVLARNHNYLDCRKVNLVVVPAKGWNRLPEEQP